MAQVLQLRKELQSKDLERKGLARLVIGELDRISKNPTDVEVTKVIKGLISSNQSTIDIMETNIKEELLALQADDLDEETVAIHEGNISYFQGEIYPLVAENTILAEWLPPQPKVLTQEEIAQVVKSSGASTVPVLMKFLGSYEKEHFVTIDKAYARGLL